MNRAHHVARRTLRFAIVGASLGVGSCSLVVDLDGLAGRVEPSGDASTTDVTTAEGAADVGTPPGPTAPFCANADAAFCDDFDGPERAFLVGPWEFLSDFDGGAAALTTSFPRSAPRAAQFTSAANIAPPAADCHYERLYRSLDVKTKRHLTLSFNAWLGDASGSLEPTDILGHLGWSASGATCSLLWSPLRPNGSLREQHPGSPDVAHSVAPGPAAGAWHRYAIDLDLVSGAVRFEFDGVNALKADEKVAATCPIAPTSASFSLGFYCAAKRLVASEVRFDDVAFDAR